jgi:hypothetical protein
MQTNPKSVFLVWGNALDGDDDALDKWYLEVHGPDMADAGVFSGLYRYRAVGPYEAKHLTVWTADFDSVDDARTTISDIATDLRAKGRVGDLHLVVRGATYFADGGGDPSPFGGFGTAGTLTLVEGPAVDVPDEAGVVHRYGPLLLCESADTAGVAATRWALLGSEGLAAPAETFADQPDPRDGWLPAEAPLVSHWRPTGTYLPS